MTMTKINSDFDDQTIIESLTVNNLAEISYERMLEILTPYVLVQVPESTETVQEQKRLDFLLARTANLHAYLRVLWSYASFQRATLKKSDPARAEEMQKKKETLYELANATKLKYEACSRKITVLMDGEGDSRVTDRVNYDSRRHAAEQRPGNSGQTQSKPETKAATPRTGGWGSV
jgi:hypothetical protein